MKFSVLIAAYRAGPFVDAALAGIRRQTHHNWEVIVVEDGSRDETEAVAARFGAAGTQPVRYDNLGRNRGVAAARNRLLELAEGDAAAFLDADDLWEPDHLATLAAAMARGAELALSGVRTFDLGSGRDLAEFPVDRELLDDPLRALFRRSVIVTSSCVALSRPLWSRVGAFDPVFRVGEDRDYWLRCAIAGARFGGTGRTTCRYAKHAASTMARTRLVAAQSVLFYEKYLTLPSVPAAWRRRLLAENLINSGRLLRASSPRFSARCFLRAWRLRPLHLGVLGFLGFTGWRLAFPARRLPSASVQ